MITVDLPMEEVRILLGLQEGQTIDFLFFNRRIVKLNGLDVVITSISDYITTPSFYRWGCRDLHMVKLNLEPIRLVIPKEQFDAEEAVEKAKASLEAAQKVLESVKGKNN